MVQYDEGPQNVAESWPPYRLAYTTLGITLNITKSNMIKASHKKKCLTGSLSTQQTQ